MISSRWHKVLADLWRNKARTILTILTITLGVFTIGFMTGLKSIMMTDTNAFYMAANPHSSIVYASPFDEEVLQDVREVPGVTEVEGRSNVTVRLTNEDGKKYDLIMDGVLPPSEMQVDLLQADDRDIPATLKDGEIWFEQSSSQIFPVEVGDMIEVQSADGEVHELRIADIVRDASLPSANYNNTLTAFTTPATVESLGGTDMYNKLMVVVDDHTKDEDRVNAVVEDISQILRDNGKTVFGTWTYNPGEHFSNEIFVGIMNILNILGWVSVLLGTFLIINTINSILSQHIRQIGIMKAVGGTGWQIAGMYLVFILSCGVLALLIALPLGAYMAYSTSAGMSSMINVRAGDFRLVPKAVIIQVITALVVPLLAAVLPILIGTRISVREAINDYGVRNGHFGRSFVDRAVEKIRFLSRPMRLSLRNAFRRKGRMALTLAALTLGGAIFIGVFNLWATNDVILNDVRGYFMEDINVGFAQPYPADDIQEMVMDVPDVTGAELWRQTEGQVLSNDGSDTERVYIMAPPSDSKLIQPILEEGRWLLPGDENAIVIGNHLLKVRPDLGLGDKIEIEIGGQEATWEIVGIFQMSGNFSPPPVYTTNEILDKYMPESGMVTSVRVTTASSDAGTQLQVTKDLEAVFHQENIQFTQITLSTDWIAQQASAFDMPVYFLLVMAIMISIVGGIGLAGMMSMNVMERTREIGVLRAVGASTGSILRMVIAEGVIVGAMSWLLGLVVSFPLTLALIAGVSQALFQQQSIGAYVVNWQGIVYWLVGSLVLATLASILPAWRAMRLTVRDSLAYE
ncbi:ABC transporter permease [bacterium]|nr:ABC transporter permease [bacterium]